MSKNERGYANPDLVIDFIAGDLGDFTVEDIVCTNCIEGFCPARTKATCIADAFNLCGAKKNSAGPLEAYQERTGLMINIERPC